jgi:hypothetical protein
MPSKLLPVSIAAMMLKNLPRASIYAKKIKSPSKLIIPLYGPKGITRHAISTEEKYITGAILKMILVVSLYTDPFLNNLITSFTGCMIPGPFLPEAILLVLEIIPVKNMAENNINNMLNML